MKPYYKYVSFKQKWKRIAAHLFFWQFFFLAQCYFGLVSFNVLKNTPALYLSPLRATIGAASIFYLTMYCIIPLFFARKKYFIGSLLLIALFISYGFADAAWESSILHNCTDCMEILRTKQPDYYNYFQRGVLNIALSRIISLGLLYQLLLSLSLPIGIKYAIAYFRQKVNAVELEKENKELELSFLKAQVNPHFLFNTLNNIYGLILNDSKEKSAETVARLANFMRYSLYQDKDNNTLDKEIQLIKDYIELEEIRLNHILVNFNYEADTPVITFPPLLFMPVLENAFKYCNDEAGKENLIEVQLILKQKQLFFKVSNTYKNISSNVPGGIGLKNIQKRLKHYFDTNYTFSIEKQEGHFTVDIRINL